MVLGYGEVDSHLSSESSDEGLVMAATLAQRQEKKDIECSYLCVGTSKNTMSSFKCHIGLFSDVELL